jgi:hypothetical protein
MSAEDSMACRTVLAFPSARTWEASSEAADAVDCVMNSFPSRRIYCSAA